MDRRKAEIEEKRTKLAELKRARAERKNVISSTNRGQLDSVRFARYLI